MTNALQALPWVASTFFFLGIIVGALGCLCLISNRGNDDEPPTAT